jgi:signal transduction histidine kinase
MQERAAAVGGKLTIENLPGNGVRLKLTIEGKNT